MAVLRDILYVAKMRPLVKPFPDGLFDAVEASPNEESQNHEYTGQPAPIRHFSRLSYGIRRRDSSQEPG